MQAMIFGIGQNPEAEEWTDRDDEFEMSPFSVYITDKRTWEDEHHCNDSAVDQKMRERLNRAGFAESEDGIFEPISVTMIKEQIRQAMEKLGYVHNEEFGKWMESFAE